MEDRPPPGTQVGGLRIFYFKDFSVQPRFETILENHPFLLPQNFYFKNEIEKN